MQAKLKDGHAARIAISTGVEGQMLLKFPPDLCYLLGRAMSGPSQVLHATDGTAGTPPLPGEASERRKRNFVSVPKPPLVGFMPLRCTFGLSSG